MAPFAKDIRERDWMGERTERSWIVCVSLSHFFFWYLFYPFFHGDDCLQPTSRKSNERRQKVLKQKKSRGRTHQSPKNEMGIK